MKARRGLAPSLAGAACAAITLSAAGATRTITIESMQFSPAMLVLKPGDEVVWVNKDLVPHTATAPKVFDSAALPPGKSWRTKAPGPGRYEYVCTLHPTMKAVLVVE
ncbi:cupredoxin domain-containing protein [Ideonella sp. YS5]|uniref:cupredoxin domain-containing protein n=1 Tax=Ideonella sp. YS5 TaxID=3453714 RepID=UPI003F721E5B